MKPSVSSGPAPTSGTSRWIVLVSALVGLIAGLVVFAFLTPSYEAQAVVDVSNSAGALSDEIAVVQSAAVLDVAESLVGFRPEISVTAADVAGSLTITANEGDPQEAAAAANAVAATYVQAQQGGIATIAQAAEIPDGRSGVGRPVFAAIGALIGAAMGFFVASVQRSQADDDAPAAGPTDPASPAAPDAAPRAGLASNSSPGLAEAPPYDPLGYEFSGSDAPAPSSLWSSVSTTKPAPPKPAPPQKPTSSDPVPSLSAPSDAPQPKLVPSEPVPSKPTLQVSNPPLGAAPSAEPPIHQPATEQPLGASLPNPAALAPLSTTTGSMTSRPSSFSDAAKSDSDDQLSWMSDASLAANTTQLSNLGRRALQKQHEAERYELVLSNAQEIARLTAEHERATADMRNEVAALHKKVRVQETRLKSRYGNDQTRVGDLEAQVDALEVELSALRQTLESERIAHTRRITEDRGAADRALDNARREYRDELGKHVHSHRQTIADYRVDLDTELAEDRARHAAALEEQHAEYERQLESERAKLEARLVAAGDQHARDIATLRQSNRQELDRQAAQHKVTITDLRTTTERNEVQIRDLEKENGLLRSEVATQQKRALQSETDRMAAERRATEELALTAAELDGERERNVALRADVLRRSAEAHQAIDKAVEERTAQLAELEASVARQRQYADTRVREISAASEEQARQAASREASLTAAISKLNRELEEAKRQS